MEMDKIYETNPMLKNKSLEHVKLTGSAQRESEFQNLTKDIINILQKEIPNLNKLKGSTSLLNNICNLIENHDSKTLVDKKQVALNVITTLFPELNSEKDLDHLSKSIDDIIEISKSVKKIARTTKLYKTTAKWLKKKFI